MEDRRAGRGSLLLRALQPLRSHPVWAGAVMLILFVLVACLDLFTRHELSFDLLYLVPILLATTVQSAAWGLGVALAATLARLLDLSDLLVRRITDVDLWNSGILLAAFILAVALVDAVVRERHHLRANEELLKRNIDEATRLAESDGLTGARNLRFLQHWFATEGGAAGPQPPTTSVLMIDVDDLKLVNDRHGHSVGNEVLTELAAILTRELRQSDIIARIGGDEFAIVLPSTDTTVAQAVAHRLHRLIAVQLPRAAHTRVTVSIGVAPLVQQSRPVGEMLELADRAMYRAKELGKNQVFQILEASAVPPAGDPAPAP